MFGMASNTAGPTTNRWTMFIPAFCTHVCLGAPYGWSAISAQLTRENGIVASAASDWALDVPSYPMSVMIAAGGISAAALGKWTIKAGVRKSLALGGLLYGAGFCLASAGVYNHNVGLMYAGNLLSGIGYGCAYTPPIQALIDWFPDRKGLASGIVIAGFGSGALFFTPMMSALTNKFCTLPTYLGNSVELVVEGGKQFAKVGGELQEVVYATSGELLKLPYSGLSEGFYVVGSGNTGVGAALATIGGIYAATVVASAMIIKRPAAGYIPAGYTPPAVQAGTGANVHVDNLFKTPQFWFLFSTSTLLATGGMGLMSVAKPMIQSVFADSMPALVTTSFASAYLMALAAGNLGGRLGWAAISDKIGRRNTFHIYTLGAIPLFGSLPFFINQCVTLLLSLRLRLTQLSSMVLMDMLPHTPMDTLPPLTPMVLTLRPMPLFCTPTMDMLLPPTPMDTLPTPTPMVLTRTPMVLGTLARGLLMLSLRLMPLFCTLTMDMLLPPTPTDTLPTLTPMVLTLTLMVLGTLARGLPMLSLRLMPLFSMETMDMLDMLPPTPMDTLDTVPMVPTPTPMVPTPTWDKKLLLPMQNTKHPSATKTKRKASI